MVGSDVDIDKMVDDALKQFRNLDRLFAQGEITEKKAFLERWIAKIDVDPIQKKCYYYFSKVPMNDKVRAEEHFVSSIKNESCPPFFSDKEKNGGT